MLPSHEAWDGTCKRHASVKAYKVWPDEVSDPKTGPFPVAQKHRHMHDTASLKGNWHGMEMLSLNVTFP